MEATNISFKIEDGIAFAVESKSNNDLARAKANADYLAKLTRSMESAKAGRVVTKTMDELKAMEENMV